MPSSTAASLRPVSRRAIVGVTFQGRMPRCTRPQCGDVGCHAVRQQRRTNRPVRGLPAASDRGRKSMHYAQSRIRQRQATEQACQCHVVPRIPVGAVVVRAAQRTGSAPDPLDANGIHKWDWRAR